MAGRVQFELVTPERVLAAEEADLVVVPGGDGNFGVLPGHAPLLSTLRPGVVDIYQGDKITSRIFVAGGFAEVAEDRFTVLADEAQAVEDIDDAAAAERLSRARDALTRAQGSDEDVAAAEAELAVAEALAVATGAH
ncbi:ATP synthase F1 subunit epsilon [Shumkonia mesophila]|uniref:ATP synthase F1 subunit epsilon n=1 Tax=Shumkonia mesophila TaxID=2838854 RepID=UPI002934FA07|nr:ATP synthase F1 subunit epsilon [Shumkonia mesophila]